MKLRPNPPRPRRPRIDGDGPPPAWAPDEADSALDPSPVHGSPAADDDVE